MTAITYDELINKTFCDNSIRSVMMIDDEFITYSESIKALTSGTELPANKIEASKRAATLEDYFQKNKMICDIDNGETDFNIDRIRKSDLIILDYHLEPDNPTKTLSILNGLRSSKHLNLVVIYTREELETVWLQIASTLKGSLDYNNYIIEHDDGELAILWSEEILPNIESEYSLTTNEIAGYISNDKIPKRIKTLLARHPNPELKQYRCYLSKAICEYNISKSNICNTPKNEDFIVTGRLDGIKWLQSGNIFITLYNKTNTEIDDAENIINSLKGSLITWKPSYYRLIKSEIQNKIEDEALSFDIHLANDLNGQAAWLHEVIKSENELDKELKIDSVFRNLSEELYFKLKENESLNQFINDVFESEKRSCNAVPNPEPLQYCASTVGLSVRDPNFYQDMYHALNMNISSRNYRERYISTGTVLFDFTNDNWYLCVSAACDMVPSQGNSPYHERLNPHRLIKVIQLFDAKAVTAIKQASHGKYIYAYENGKRVYLTVTNPVTLLPVVDYMAILNHIDQNGKREVDAIVWRSKDNDNDIENSRLTLKLKSQLRSGYAERYQSIASQFIGRIGVDYIGYSLPETVI